MFDNLKHILGIQKSAAALNTELPRPIFSIDDIGSSGASKPNLKKAYELSLYVNRAIDKRAEKVSEVEWQFKRGDEIVENEKDWTPLLYRPNDVLTGRKFWGLASKLYDVFGEVYIWKEMEGKTVKGLHFILNTSIREVKRGSGGEIVKVLTNTGKEYDGEHIIFHHRPRIDDMLKGASILMAGMSEIDTNIQLTQYQQHVLKNGGRIDGVFSFENTLTEEQARALKSSYEEQYAEAKKSGKPLFMGGMADYKRISASPEELAYAASKNISLNDICMMTGVPKAVLGSVDDVKFDNADASHKIFLRETIRPLLVDLADILNEMLIPEELELTFVDPTPEDKEYKLKAIENGIRNYYLTPNEARKMRGLEPIDGGDELLIPFSLIPASEAGSDPYATDDGTKSAKSQTKEFEHPLRDKDIRLTYHKMMIKRMKKRETPYLRALNGYLDAQRDRVLERLELTKSIRRKTLLDTVFEARVEKDAAIKFSTPVLLEIIRDSISDAFSVFGTGDEPDLSGDVQTWVTNRAEFFANSINATTHEKLAKEFAESLAEGETREQLVKRIEDTYGGIKKNRAITIARTEVHGATQFGTYEAQKQAGLPTKIWVATFQNTRDTHAEMDGQEVAHNMPFTSKSGARLMYPSDSSLGAPPEEIINCQCSV